MNATAGSEEPRDLLNPPVSADQGRVPALLDPGIAHPARVYSYWLGGSAYYPADREVALEVVRLRPEVLAGARANRAFGRRVTAYAATGACIRQFLDIGAGLPAPEATHQVAQQVSSACRTLYVDSDPVVIAHIQARLAAAPAASGADCLDADLRDPADLLESASEVLDFTQPVAVLLLAVLHFIPDHNDPGQIISQLAAALAPGSLIAISHLTADYAPRSITDCAALYNARVPMPVYPRSRDQIAALLGPLPARHPGVVPVSHWQPSLREPAPQPVDICAAVARIPSAALSRSQPRSPLTEIPGTGQGQVPHSGAAAEAEVAEMTRRAAEFPDYEITREAPLGGTHYVAQGHDLSIHPYLVVASDLGKLFAALAAAK